MFGQLPFGGVPDFCDGVGADFEGAGLVVGVEPVGLGLVGAAAAPAIPTAAPPAASTPVRIAALSIFELCIGASGGECRASVGDDARRS
jgi:hypothetical protein